VDDVCGCSGHVDGLSSLLDSRLLVAVIVWSLLLSIVILAIIVVIVVDNTSPQSIHIPFLPLFHTESSSSLSFLPPSRRSSAPSPPSTPLTDTADTLPPASVTWPGESDDDSQSAAWLQRLRGENWILYPADVTLISHRRSQPTNQRSLHHLQREFAVQ